MQVKSRGSLFCEQTHEPGSHCATWLAARAEQVTLYQAVIRLELSWEARAGNVAQACPLA